MAKILFNKNVELFGFNLGAYNSMDESQNITYPTNQIVDSSIEDATRNSVVYSFVNKDMYVNNHLYAKYKSKALSRDKYIIYKQIMGEDIKRYIATIGGVTDGFFDYNIENNVGYKYIVETNPANQNQSTTSTLFKNQSSDSVLPVSLETEYYVKPHWNYWSICDIDKNFDTSLESDTDIYIPSDQIFHLKGNVQIGDINDNLNIIKYNTLGQYGKIIQNQQKFDSGNIGCLIGDFKMVQFIENVKKIVVNEDVKTVESRDAFFQNLSTSTNDVYQLCYRFPYLDNHYYTYQPQKANNIYLKFDGNVELMEDSTDPIFWAEHFSDFYEKDGQTYKPLTDAYVKVEIQPDNWEEVYYEYYVYSDGKYVHNLNDTWQETESYYEYTIPQFSKDYYYLAVNTWHPVDNKYVYANNIDTLKAWRQCLSNGKLKLLKAPNGQMWVVRISDATNLNTNWESSNYPTSINFNWQEVLDINKISIIKW